MIALDTNVLVRYLVEDDEAQTRLAKAVVRRAVAKDEPLFVSDIVVCELVWVLEGNYEVPRGEIRELLESLFRARHLAFRDVDALLRALHAFQQGKGDFSDYLIAEHARESGADVVVTFDRALLNQPGFRRP
jgi:predicted nucleic-acid-binding protein